jgi:HAMP domain-containing protein
MIASHAATFRWDENIDRLEHTLHRVAAGQPAHLGANA